MTTNDDIKPLVDRILMNPLQFTQVADDTDANKGSNMSSETIKNTSYIVIGNRKSNGIENNKADQKITNVKVYTKNDVVKESENFIKPKSMAEALAMYTKSDKKTDNKKTEEELPLNQDDYDSTMDANGDGTGNNVNNANSNDLNGAVTGKDTDHLNSEKHNRDEEVKGSSESDDMDYQDNDPEETGSSELSDSESMSSNDLIDNLISNTRDSNMMEEDVGEDVGEALEMIRKETTVEKDMNSDINENSEDSDEYENDDGEKEEEDNIDTDDEIDQISDSERIGLLEESIANEIEKEKRRDTQSSNTTKEHDENVAIDNREQSDEDLKHKLPFNKRGEVAKSSSELEGFYQFNENIADEGSILPSKIIKNWGPEMSSLKPRGLLNHGVTCYTNAAVQAMLHIPSVQHYLWDVLRGKYAGIIKPTSVTMTLAETSKKIWFPNDKLKKKLPSYINPNKLINRLEDINCMMSEWQQEDSHEYFMSLMSRLQEDSVPKGHKMTESIIYDIFGGLLKQLVTCKSCGGVSKTEQPFYDLSLHLRGKKSNMNENTSSNTSINDGSTVASETKKTKLINDKSSDVKDENVFASTLANDKDKNSIKHIDTTSQSQANINRKFTIEKSIGDFFSPELIKVDNEQKGYVCEKCHKTTNAVKRNSILRAPETLLVHLKKFRFNGTSSSKMKQAVSYPMFLDLTEYCEKESIPAGRKQLSLKYQLISVVVHEGRSLSSGHYITHCKQPDGSWATYDDEYINKITERDVLREPNAYYLIYTRLTPKSIKLKNTLPKEKIVGLPYIKNKNNKNGSTDKHKGLNNNKNSPDLNSNILSLANNNKNRKKWKKNKKRKLNK